MPFATHLHKFAVVNADVIGEPDHLFGDFFMDLSQAQVVWQQEGKGEWLRRRCRQARVKETGSRRFRIVRLNLYLHKSRDKTDILSRYLGFNDISVSAKMADFIGLSKCWQTAVLFLTHPDNLR